MNVEQLTVAKCENCGAALRVESSATEARCEYCGVTSVTPSASQAAPDAPKLRITPPPALEDTAARGAVPPGGCFAIGSILILVGPVGFAWGWSIFDGVVFACGGLVAIVFGLLIIRDRRRRAEAVAELDRFRREGLLGRATVETIAAGTGRRATLGLKIEVAGQPDQHIEHEAVIPELLVPRLVEGLKLPVIVEGGRVEVQWHLI
ncbi:MAG: hypothetical protein JRI23_36235 [Deltaproteobacteria bacterium]|jgi:predicted RNA-binding Zn-ribbon protein involved in translation (DUF1610 family)|nr:hypothetical protein [Deltaproteobacteria bacterium]MBW2537799.1 hypothetical protein [Deltaproteobacteria bacterium]